MKRHLYSIAATFAALALCSCASYEEEAGTIGNGNPETDGIHSFRAEMATSDSRAGIDGSNSVWEEGDDLSIVKFANGQTAPELVRAAVRKGSLSADGRSAIRRLMRTRRSSTPYIRICRPQPAMISRQEAKVRGHSPLHCRTRLGTKAVSATRFCSDSGRGITTGSRSATRSRY